MVGIVLVSHSADLARGLADLVRQVAGTEVRVEPAGGGPDGTLGTSGDRVTEAIARADTGDGVVLPAISAAPSSRCGTCSTATRSADAAA